MDDDVSFPAMPTRKKRRTDASVNVTGRQVGVDIFRTKRTIDRVTMTLDASVNHFVLASTPQLWTAAKACQLGPGWPLL